MVQVVEGRPQVCVFVPALEHHLVELLRAAVGLGHAVAVLHALDHLAVVHTCGHRKHTNITKSYTFINE